MKRIKVVALALLLLTGIALVIQQQRFGSKQENKVTEFRDQPESKDGEKMNSEPRQENTGPLFISTSQSGIHDSPFFIFNQRRNSPLALHRF